MNGSQKITEQDLFRIQEKISLVRKKIEKKISVQN